MSQLWPAISGATNVLIDDLIDRLNSLRSNWAGTARPSTPVAGQLFFDTDSGPIMEVCTNASGPVWAGLATVLSPSELLTAIKTVDGAGSGLDADLLDGQSGAYYLAASSYTAADVLAKLLTVDGSGSGLDADLLDGQSGTYYLAASSYTAADVLAKLLTVDGAGSGIDADLLDGLSSAAFGQVGTINTWALAQTFTLTPIFSANITVGASVAAYIGGGTNNAFVIDPSFGIGGRTTASVEFLIDSNNDDTTRVFRIRTNSAVLGSGGTVVFEVNEAGAMAGNFLVPGANLADNGVSLAKLAQMATDGILGRATASTGNVEVLTALPFAFTGDVTRAADSNTTALDVTAITGKTADTAPDMAADYVLTHDASASALKKVLLQYIGAGKQAFWVPASGMAARASNGCAALATLETATNKINYDHLAFDATTQEFAVFDWRAPKAIDTGTFTAIIVWSHPSTATNFGVVWGVSGMGRGDGDVMEVAMGTAVTATDTGGTTDTLYVSPVTAAFTMGGSFAAEDVLKYQISRNPADGSDTLAVDARLHGVYLIFNTVRNTEV